MRNSRRAGKPAGRKPEKQGLTGLFTKGKNIPTTAQQTLPYREMYRDGVCRVADRYYTKTIEYEDINYQLAQSEDQAAIFDGWSACLNYFDSSLPFQLSFLNHRSRPGSRYSVNIPMQDDDYNSVRCEYVEMLENQIAKSNNGIVRTKLLTFGVNVDDLPTARARLERVEADICGNFKKLGVKCRSLSGLERLELLHGQLHPGSGSPFRFSWDMIPKTGLSTKDFIAPDSFDFRFSRLFRVGTTWGAASYLQILASELSDKLLAELLEMDAEMTITLHIQTVDQAAAVKSIKAKVSDIDKMKVEEQKKAARSGYDMDILPPDLVTYSNDAKTLLEDLQSRNERMFLLTFLVVNMAPTRRELDNDLFTVSGIVQKYNCTLKRLDFQQEDGFLSSLPLGHNGIEIKRGMTTSSTAIFVPFMTQELRMDGEAVYYGLNALSHNVIMANRKKLKNPNGLFLGVPGSGKSFAAKRELVNVFLATRDRIIVVDPMGEYSPLIKRLGGQVIEIAPDSPHHINPMDIDLSFDEENPMALKADFKVIHCTVNGKVREIAVDERESLTDMLRLRLGLTSVKKGCEAGECGACTVLIDGVAKNSCILLAVWADGHEIITVEGIRGKNGLLHPVQQAFVDEAAIQCGFCTPGLVLTGVELVNSGKRYTREQLREKISGHLCRCTGYENILNALEKVVGVDSQPTA